MDICLLRTDSSFVSRTIVPGISDHNGAFLKVEWDEICREPKVEIIVPVCHKTDVLGFQTSLQEKFNRWAGNCSCLGAI